MQFWRAFSPRLTLKTLNIFALFIFSYTRSHEHFPLIFLSLEDYLEKIRNSYSIYKIAFALGLSHSIAYCLLPIAHSLTDFYLFKKQRLLAHFYMDGVDAIHFKEQYKGDKSITYWEKLQMSLQPNLPRDLQTMEGQTSAQSQVQQQALSHFWAFLKGLIYN